MADNTSMLTTAVATRAADYLLLLRPTQWVKNIVIFAGPAGALQLFTRSGLINTCITFAAFCLVASATYIINDIFDRQADAVHPRKRHRPLAKGTIAPATGWLMAIVCVVAGLSLAWLTNTRVVAIIGCYFVMTVLYSLYFKHHVIIDVLIIATGFVLRGWAGTEAVNAVTSDWLVVCLFTLCLCVGLGKRRCEIATLRDQQDARQHRATLLRYTPELLNHLITVSSGIAIITFLLYTLDTSAPPPFPKHQLLYTLPLVMYGIFRYAMLTETAMFSGPEEIFYKDRPFLFTMLLWTAIALLIASQRYWVHLVMPYVP